MFYRRACCSRFQKVNQFFISIHFIVYIIMYVVQIRKLALWYSSFNNLSHRSNYVIYECLCTRRIIENVYLIDIFLVFFLSKMTVMTDSIFFGVFFSSTFVMLIPICTQSTNDIVLYIYKYWRIICFLFLYWIVGFYRFYCIIHVFVSPNIEIRFIFLTKKYGLFCYQIFFGSLFFRLILMCEWTFYVCRIHKE